MHHLISLAIALESPELAVRTDTQWRFTQMNHDTQRKAAQDALRASEEHHRLLFQASLDAIFSTDGAGIVLSANPAACRMFRLTESQLCGRRMLDFVGLWQARISQAPMRDCRVDLSRMAEDAG